jgi:hypothetical protein
LQILKYIFIIMNYLAKLWKVGGLYFIWIGSHFIASHLYSTVCAPPSFTGLLMSPFVTATPICSALRWCINQGADTISVMWIVFGTWCIGILAQKD